MDGLALIIVVSIGLFLVYRFGLVALAQNVVQTATTSVETARVVADRQLEYWEQESEQVHDKRMGKLFTKLDAADYTIASKADIAKLRKAKLAELSVNKNSTESK